MTDLELAEEIERQTKDSDTVDIQLPPNQWQKIIAALRRVPERPPSGEMVMVPREPTKEMLAAMVVANVEHDKICEAEGWDGIRRSERIYRAMLSAAEAEGRKS